MGKSGRYGKYGETKRLARLRKAGKGPTGGSREPEMSRTQSFRRTSSRGDKIKIIPASTKDVDYIRSLSKKVFTRYGPYDATLTGWFLSGFAWTVLASTGKRPVGFAMLGRTVQDHTSSPVFELLAIAIEPEMQKLGIGGRLLNKIERKAKELNAETLILHTSADNAPGLKLFRKHGFVTAETKGHFYPEGQDALMMYKTFVYTYSGDSVEG